MESLYNILFYVGDAMKNSQTHPGLNQIFT